MNKIDINTEINNLEKLSTTPGWTIFLDHCNIIKDRLLQKLMTVDANESSNIASLQFGIKFIDTTVTNFIKDRVLYNKQTIEQKNKSAKK